jgi:hypothetical protein
MLRRNPKVPLDIGSKRTVESKSLAAHYAPPSMVSASFVHQF